MQLHLLQIIECVAHGEVLSEVLLEEEGTDVANVAKWEGELARRMETICLECVIPYIKQQGRQPLLQGDGLFVVRSGLKAAFAILLHLPRERQQTVIEAVDKVGEGRRLLAQIALPDAMLTEYQKKWLTYCKTLFL